MTLAQDLWITQTRSEHRVLTMLLESEFDTCQKLHYLQMVTEKLSKAYFEGRPSNVMQNSHKAFRQFVKNFGIGWNAKTKRAFAKELDFRDFRALEAWLERIDDLIYEIERLAPALNKDGPNPEYPWPRTNPQFAPATFSFPLWSKLQTQRGEKLLSFLELLINQFERIK